VATLGDVVLLPVSEFESGADLNGDTDTNDRVLHRFDTRTDAVINLMLACAGPILTSDQRFAFTVSEGSQRADLNGDGDTADRVWHIHDLTAQTTTNLGIAAPAVGDGIGTIGGFILLRSELGEGIDLNGDGDVLDDIAVIFDGVTGALGVVVPGAYAIGRPLVARNGRILIPRSEASAATDLNLDGDQIDIVLGAVAFGSGVPTFFELGRAVSTLPYTMTDDAAAYFIDEATGTLDVNGDGDMTDAIIAVFNFPGGAGFGESTPFNGGTPGFAMAASAVVGIGAGQHHIMVAISEGSHFGTDLNIDGDMFDSVLGWVDTNAAPTVMNLVPRAVGNLTPSIDGTRGLFVVREANEGIFVGTDLNGDGDDQDEIAFRLDTTAGTVTNLGFAVNLLATRGDDALLGVLEAAQGRGPLNEDGDTDDTVLRYLDLNTLATRNLAIVSAEFTFVRRAPDDLRLAAILAEGQSVPFGDLNEDGDMNDRALVLVKVDSTGATPLVVAPTPEVSDTAATDMLPPLEVNADVFLIPTSENFVGQDRNADADSTDTVLTEITVKPPP